MYAKAKIYARAINDGRKKWPDDIPAKYHDLVIEAYWELFGEHLEG